MIRFSLLELFGVTSFVALILGIVSYTGSILVGIHLSLCLTGWLMRRLLHGQLGGIIPALLGGDFLLCSSVAWVHHGSEDFMGIHKMLDVIATLVVCVGLGALVWVGIKRQRFWKQQIAIATIIAVILAAWWIAVPALGNAAIARRRASDIAANKVATARAIAMVEEVRQRSGMTPNEDGLRELLREPLPSVRWDGLSGQIQYHRTGDTTFQLSYIDPSMFFGDIVIYDSATPKKGWYRITF
jgi:hypothetical protein